MRVVLVVPGEIAARIDAEARRSMRRQPGSHVTRSDVVRRAIYSYLLPNKTTTAEGLDDKRGE